MMCNKGTYRRQLRGLLRGAVCGCHAVDQAYFGAFCDPVGTREPTVYTAVERQMTLQGFADSEKLLATCLAMIV